MPKLSDEKLIAYLDGELDERECADIAPALEHGDGRAARPRPTASERERASLLRAAFDEVLREPLPDRLIAAARGETAKVVSIFSRVRRGVAEQRRWWIGIPVAASLMGLLIGGGLGYFAGDEQGATATREAQANIGSGMWLDSLAGYHKLFVNAGPNDARRLRRTCRPMTAYGRKVRRRSCRPISVCPISSRGAWCSRARGS